MKIKDAVVISDVYLASYAAYHGYQIMKTSDRNNGEWTFFVPEHDFEILKEEFANAETPIYVKEFVNSIKSVQHAVVLAKRNCGEYITAEFRKIVQGR